MGAKRDPKMGEFISKGRSFRNVFQRKIMQLILHPQNSQKVSGRSPERILTKIGNENQPESSKCLPQELLEAIQKVRGSISEKSKRQLEHEVGQNNFEEALSHYLEGFLKLSGSSTRPCGSRSRKAPWR